jgi:hypothetical protein
MVIDNELIVDSGVELIRAGARVPMMSGVARKEWGHKKRNFFNIFAFSHYSNLQPSFTNIIDIPI